MLSYATLLAHVRRSDDESLFPLRYQLVPATAGIEDAVMAGELFAIEDSKAALPSVCAAEPDARPQPAGQLLNLRW